MLPYVAVRLLETDVLADWSTVLALGALFAPLRLLDDATLLAARDPAAWAREHTDSLRLCHPMSRHEPAPLLRAARAGRLYLRQLR